MKTDVYGVRGTADWTFRGRNVRQYTHCYHDYPARMIPQIAHKHLLLYGVEDGFLFDPYCGTGTTLVEAMIAGMNALGTDINPLARLIAEAKVTLTDPDFVKAAIDSFETYSLPGLFRKNDGLVTRREIPNMEFWFKPEVAADRSAVLAFTERIENRGIRKFFEVAFSETVRESCNSKAGEFKLCRRKPSDLENFHPDVFGIMLVKLRRNLEGLRALVTLLRGSKSRVVTVESFDTCHAIPAEVLPDCSVDIVVTLPPYGDSHTTVAYGQYSRLSAEWLGLREPRTVDRRSMGGTIPASVCRFDCRALDESISAIAEIDRKRAREVSGFYRDLRKFIANVAAKLKPGAHACYVVANRKVKGVILPTDQAIKRFFECSGCEYVATFERDIPNKRMPLKNSPSNVPGELDATMTREVHRCCQKGTC